MATRKRESKGSKNERKREKGGGRRTFATSGGGHQHGTGQVSIVVQNADIDNTAGEARKGASQGGATHRHGRRPPVAQKGGACRWVAKEREKGATASHFEQMRKKRLIQAGIALTDPRP